MLSTYLRISAQITFNYKGRNSKFTVEKPGRRHLNHVIKVKLIVLEQMNPVCNVEKML